MKSDSDLLFDRIRADPNDIALLMAYSDALEEEGRSVRAGLVKGLVEAMQNSLVGGREETDGKVRWAGRVTFGMVDNEDVIHRLRRRLRILPLQVGELVTVDEEGRAIPYLPDGTSQYGVVLLETGDGLGTVVLLDTGGVMAVE